jgi:hypothetical protein
MFVGKAGAYPVEGPFRCSTLALPTSNRLGWKGLPRTNTLALYKNMKILGKMFYNIESWGRSHKTILV